MNVSSDYYGFLTKHQTNFHLLNIVVNYCHLLLSAAVLL